MIKKTILSTLIIMVLWLLACQDHQQDHQQPSLYLNNRQPLITKPYVELPLGAIRAEGWLKEQLVRQKNGLTGNLDEVYEQVVGSRNGWLGGDGDVWERGPYWIDGLLPLAYILDDQELIDKTTPWIEWTLNSQHPNVLLLVSDEHNSRVAGFAGDPVVHTPALDGLAARGVAFENAF